MIVTYSKGAIGKKTPTDVVIDCHGVDTKYIFHCIPFLKYQMLRILNIYIFAN